MREFQSHTHRSRISLVFLGVILTTWTVYMTVSSSWGLFREGWPVSLTMAIGSFIAGSTPQGGAAVAFPVFTKVLRIPPADARTFGLMIQTIGMGMATVTIIGRRIRILPRVIVWATLGGVFGQVLGTYYFVVPNPYPRVLFSLGAAAFGVALAFSRWAMAWSPRPGLPGWSNRYRAMFFVTGIFGGMAAAHTGSGADMLIFIVLTLIFGVDVKVSTPTTVIIMALNSMVGFFLHGVVSQDIGPMWEAWLVAVPIVAFGAPLGALTVNRIGSDILIAALIGLITVEFATTLWLIPFTPTMIWLTFLLIVLCAACFAGMLVYRQRQTKAAGT